MKNYFMLLALKEALTAYKNKEVPVGCIIVVDNKVVARTHNLTRSYNDPTAHAEILAIREAASYLKNYRLNNADMYVSLEPCSMCTGAIIEARIKNLYIALEDKKRGAVISNFKLQDSSVSNHKLNYELGLYREYSKRIIQNFFRKLRN